MANWRRRFDEPINLRDGTVIATLADARDWLIGTGRDEFQKAAGDLITAADGGDIAAARQSIAMAAFLIGFQLDLSKEPHARHRD